MGNARAGVESSISRRFIFFVSMISPLAKASAACYKSDKETKEPGKFNKEKRKT